MKTHTPTKEEFESAVRRLRRVANAVDGRARSYSGRFMYGAECFAISCEDPNACIEEAAENGFRGAKIDSLGLRYIVYWPRMVIPEGFEFPDDND